MAGRDPDAQRRGPDHELERRAQVDGLAVNPGVDWPGGIDLDIRRAPGAWWVENDDPEPTATEGRAGAGCDWEIQGVGVVGDEHHRRVTVLAAQVVHQVQLRRRPAWTEHRLCGLEQGTHLLVAVTGLPHRVAIDPERDVVEEHAAVHLGHVDPALDPVGERVERADQIVPIHPQVEREVVACAGGDAHEGKPVRLGSRRDDRKRPVATGDAERIRTTRDRVTDQGRQAVIGAQDDHLDPSLPRPLGNAGAPRPAPTGRRVDEQHRVPQRTRRRPIAARLRARGTFGCAHGADLGVIRGAIAGDSIRNFEPSRRGRLRADSSRSMALPAGQSIPAAAYASGASSVSARNRSSARVSRRWRFSESRRTVLR